MSGTDFPVLGHNRNRSLINNSELHSTPGGTLPRMLVQRPSPNIVEIIKAGSLFKNSDPALDLPINRTISADEVPKLEELIYKAVSTVFRNF